MEKCAARLQPQVDQEKPIQHQTFAIEKFQDLIVTTRSCPGDKNSSLKKYFKNYCFRLKILQARLCNFYFLKIFLLQKKIIGLLFIHT